MSKSTNERPSISPMAFQGLSVSPRSDMQALTGLGQTYVRSVARWHEEMSRFLSHRFGKDAKAIHAAAGCKDIPALLSVQQKWANEMVNDYLEQSSRMVTVVAEMGDSALDQTGPDSQEAKQRASSD